MSCRSYRARTTRIAARPARHGEARPINSEIYKITEAYHGVGKLCDSGRSRRCIRGPGEKLNYTVDPWLLCRWAMRILLCVNMRLGRYRCLGSRSRGRKRNRGSSLPPLGIFLSGLCLPPPLIRYALSYGHFYKTRRARNVPSAFAFIRFSPRTARHASSPS